MSSCATPENITIRAWQCGVPQPIGCISHDGYLYINLKEGNTADPAMGSGSTPPTYAGAFDLCGLIEYLGGDPSTVTDNGDGTVSAVDSDGTVTATWDKSGTTIQNNGDGTISALDSSGATVATWSEVDTDTTYTYALVNDIFTATDSNGNTQTVTIEHPPQTVDTDTITGAPNVDAVSGMVTWPVLDKDGNQINSITGDFSGFISSPHPAITASGDATAVFNAVSNEWTVGFVDTDTNTTYTLTQDGAGNTLLTPSDGSAPQVIANTDTNTTSSLIVDTAARSYVHNDGDGNDTPLPIATALPCEVTAPTGLVDDKWVNDFIDRGHQFGTAALNGVSNECDKSVISTTNGVASGARSSLMSTVNSSAAGAGAAGIATNSSDTTGNYSVSIAALNCETSGQTSLTTGNGNTNSGSQSIAGGIGNDSSAVAALTSGAGNVNSGNQSLMTGNSNNNSAVQAIVGGLRVTVTGPRSISTGADNTNGGQYSILGGFDNISSAGSSITVGTSLNVAGNYHSINGVGHVVAAGSDSCTVTGVGHELTANALQGLAVNQNNRLDASHANVFGRSTENNNNNTTVWGMGTGLPILTSNRTVEIDHSTGNITTSGTLTTSAVFAGIGEKAIAAETIPEGTLVVFEGEAGVRVAKKGELPDGVTTKELVMTIGGGIDPDNSPWLLDGMGNRVIEEVEVTEEIDEVDEKAFAKAESEASEDETVDREKFTKKVKRSHKVNQPTKNPKYNPKQSLETVCVEMLGRQWALNPQGLTVGDYMTGGHVAGKSGFRVLAVRKDSALLLVK